MRAAWVALLLTGCAGFTSPRELFPIGMYVAADRIADGWNPPQRAGRPFMEVYRRMLHDMARHHINVVVIEGTSGIPVEILREIIREGEKYGILTWASENGKPDLARQRALRDERGLLAWSPFDEPLMEQMAQWKELKRQFEEADPNHPVICVTHGGPKGFESFSVVQACDYYPVMVENPDLRSVAPFVARYVATGKPIWFVQQAFHGEGRRLPTPAEGRLMTYLALAHGVKGILYFIYDHLTDPVQNPTDLWDDTQKMGRVLATFGPELLDTHVEKPQGITVAAPAQFGVLRSKRGHAYVVAYNPNVNESIETVVEFDAKRTRLALEPGGGKILVWGGPEPTHSFREWPSIVRLPDLQRKVGAKRQHEKFWSFANRYFELEERFDAKKAEELERELR